MGKRSKNLIPKIDQDDLNSEKLIEYHGKSVVIFSADWCPYCVSFFNNWTYTLTFLISCILPFLMWN